MATRTEMSNLWKKYQSGKVMDLEDGCTHPVKMKIAELEAVAHFGAKALADANIELGLKNQTITTLRKDVDAKAFALSAAKELLEEQYALVARYQEELAVKIESEEDENVKQWPIISGSYHQESKEDETQESG